MDDYTAPCVERQAPSPRSNCVRSARSVYPRAQQGYTGLYRCAERQPPSERGFSHLQGSPSKHLPFLRPFGAGYRLGTGR